MRGISGENVMVIFPWSQEELQRCEEEKRREAEIDAAWQKARTETVVFIICKCFGVDAGGQVQAAIDAGDEKQLVKLLQDFKGTHASLSFDFALFSVTNCERGFLCTAAREHSPFNKRILGT